MAGESDIFFKQLSNIYIYTYIFIVAVTVRYREEVISFISLF